VAVISIVPRFRVSESARIDAEFYRPDRIALSNQLAAVPTVPLWRLADISDGNHLKIADLFVDEGGVRYLRGQDVSSRMLIEDDNPTYVPTDVFGALHRSHIQADDVLVTIVGASTGRVALVHDPPPQLTASCKLGIVRARRADPGYLYAFLTSAYGQSQIERARRGGAQTGLVLPDLRNLPVPRLGPQVEGPASQRVREGHAHYATSRARHNQAQKLLLSKLSLVGWEAPRPLSYTRPRSTVVRAQRMDAEHFHPRFEAMWRQLPPRLTLEPLGRLVTDQKGTEVGASRYSESGVPFWRVSNLRRWGLDATNAVYIPHATYRLLQDDFAPRQGQLLLSKDGTPGVALYVDAPVDGVVSSGILRLTVVGDISPWYLELVLNSIVVRLQIEQAAGGSVITHWKPSDMRRTLIPRLGRDTEDAISRLVEESHHAAARAKHLLESARPLIEVAIAERAGPLTPA
jgi:type I restriction enzyme S subunit